MPKKKIIDPEQIKKEEKEVEEQVQTLIIGDYEPDIEDKLLIPGKGGYSINDKVLAIMYMEVVQEQNNDGKMQPRYAHVERYIGVNESTLRAWWKKREIIKYDGDQFLDTVNHWLSLEVARESVDTIRVLKNADKKKMVKSAAGFKSMTDYLKTIVMLSRLLQHKSTANIDHHHKHKGDVTLVIPDEEDRKKKV